MNSPELERATMGTRFMALLMDNIIYTMVITVPFYIIVIVNVIIVPHRLFWHLPVFIMITVLICGLQGIRTGQSFGKRTMNIAIRKREDSSEIPSNRQLFLRNILNLFWPLEFLVYVFSSDQVKIGDRLIDAEVYQLPSEADDKISYAKKRKKSAIGCAIATGVCFLSLLSLVWGMNHPSRQVALEHLKTCPYVLELTGEIDTVGWAGVSMGGQGGYRWATHSFAVMGSEGRFRISVNLERIPGQEWEVIVDD